ncbi:MAG TPA: hypothetical protein VLI90_00010 [Tepidisphaeraceae bacterium]|nr:hypothetical protein [Tepidisphaeraceae bacterium]
MSLDGKLRKRLERALAVVDDHGTDGTRLIDDAHRLWRRVQKFLNLNLIPNGPNGADLDALELASYALQLPFRQNKVPTVGKLGRTNLKERAEQAAEMLLGLLGDDVDESLLDRATRLLHELPHRSPMLDEARLLADAVNLEDFGVTGLIQQAVQLSRQGEGLMQVAEGAEKREQYGYWNARLKDGFHFDPVRQMALRRLENARTAAKLLAEEMAEDV